MKLLGTTLAGILVLTLCSASSVRSPDSQWTRDPGLDDQWEEYLTQFDKVYSTPEEIAYRRGVWERRLLKIDQHNLEADKGLHTWWMGINQFTDMPEDEVAAMFPSSPPNMDNLNASDAITFFPTIANELDWRTKGMVTPVKNQGRTCGACYAFADVGAIESAYAIKHGGKMEDFSEQELVDCSKKYKGNRGCIEGQTHVGFKYLIDLKSGIDRERCYPYIGKENPACMRSTAVGCLGAVVHAQGLVKSEENLLKTLNIAPVTVTVCLTNGLLHYRNGIFYDVCPQEPSKYHCMLAVGYGERAGRPYWIVKNSYGTTYGENGYIMIERNRNTLKIGDYGNIPML